MARVSFSYSTADIYEISLHHADLIASLRLFFSSGAPSFATRFLGYSAQQVASDLDSRIAEIDMAYSMTILAALEGRLRTDYLQRSYRRLRDPLSKALRRLHDERDNRAGLDDEILSIWKDHTTGLDRLIGDLRGAFKYRHWLAHGRYWEPKLGRKYDFNSIFGLAVAVLANFPLETA
jgi:hypothetical protein